MTFEENYIGYNDAYDLIAVYVPRVLVNFADGWGRFPFGDNAIIVAEAIRRAADSWEKNHSISVMGNRIFLH